MNSSVSLIDFGMFVDSYRKERGSNDPITNTRIGKHDAGIYGGTYSIPDSDYPMFLNKYSTEILEKGKCEYLTEFQLLNNGPCLVDMDFRHDYDTTTERMYTKDHLDDLVNIYVDELTRMFQMDHATSFNIYVMEKPGIRRDDVKRIVKDGIHMIIGLSCERKMQIVLRQRVIQRLKDMWGQDEIGLTNTWEEVLDEGIANGSTGWQLYGSTKPECLPYELTHIYTIGYDEMDCNVTFDCRSSTQMDWSPVWRDLLPLLSARCRTHPRLFYKSEFARELDRMTLPIRSSGNTFSQQDASGAIALNLPFTAAVLTVRNADDLEHVVQECLQACKESADEKEWKMAEVYEYAMILPSTYYGEGSYTQWLKVGIALKSVHLDAFFIWVAFSAKSPSFDWDISALHTKWESFTQRENGLSVRSIMFWCQADAKDKCAEVRRKCGNMRIDRISGSYEEIDLSQKTVDQKGTTDVDLASVLHNLYGDCYKCVSINDGVWYKYCEPRWVKIDAGVNLRRAISTELRSMYFNKAIEYMTIKANLSPDEDDTKIKKISKFIEKMNAVAHRLGKTVEKKNIMTEAKELFYDPDFLDKLDANPFLLCFKNGVVDFKAKKFRPGTPEDYLSKCTGYDYTHVNVNEPNPVVDEVRDFMRKLFPLPRLHDYMWQHLAATLIGVLPDQTWNIYLGEGKNGKSVLVKLMEYVHGDYRGEMPVGVLTQDRGKIGGAMPEIVALKGLRLAVATEGRKGDCINDAVVKQLVSGIDAIQARGLYCAKMEVFYPQFKLVFMTNNLMKVKSNDFGTWRRIRVVPFMVLFTDNPVHDDPDAPYQVKIDRSIEHKLIGWKEVMASMLVDIAFQTEGVVTDCEEVLSASNAYRQSQDCLAEFINEELIQDNDPNSRITPAIVMHHFRTWYENNNYDRRDMPKTKELTAYLDKKFKRKQGKDWIGVRINFDAEQTEFIDNNDIPTY